MSRTDVLTIATRYRSGDKSSDDGLILCNTICCKNPATITTFWSSGHVIRHCAGHVGKTVMAAAYATAIHPAVYR